MVRDLETFSSWTQLELVTAHQFVRPLCTSRPTGGGTRYSCDSQRLLPNNGLRQLLFGRARKTSNAWNPRSVPFDQRCLGRQSGRAIEMGSRDGQS